MFRLDLLELLFELGNVGFFGLRVIFVREKSLVETIESVLAIVERSISQVSTLCKLCIPCF